MKQHQHINLSILQHVKASFMFVMFFMLPALLFSQDNLSWAGAWQYGTSESAETDSIRDLAFLSSGGAVLVLDIADPSNPQLIYDDIRTRGRVLDINYDYANENLWLACNEAGLEVWNISDPENPYFISNTEILYGGVETPVEQVEQYQQFAILECSWGYVQAVDMIDPENPVQTGFNGTMGNPAHDIAVTDNGYVHATGAQYYSLLQINPNGSLSGDPLLDLNAGAVFGRTAEKVYLYADGALRIIDLTTNQSSATALAAIEIKVRNDTVFALSPDSLVTLDATDFLNPQYISNMALPGIPAEISLKDNLAFVATGYDGLRAIDFTDPANPVESSHHEGTHVTWKSSIQDDYAYLSNSGTGLSIIDISDPYENGPHRVGRLTAESEVRDLSVDGDLAVMADYSSGVRMIDISDKENPFEVNRIEGFNAWRLYREQELLFIGEAVPNQPDTLIIYNISDPENPQFVSKMTLGDLIWEIEYQNAFLYLPNHNEGLKIIDVTDPYQPVEASVVDLPSVWDISLHGDMAYLASADWDGGLVTLDISDPYDPQILNIYNPDGWFHPSKVSAEGDFAFTAELFGKVRMFDISDPLNPQELDEYTTSGDIVHIHALNNMLYVSDGKDGLQILGNSLYTTVPEVQLSETELKLYPNPASDVANFDIVLLRKDKLRIEVFSLSGQKLYEEITPQLQKGKHTLQIDVAGLQNRGNVILMYRISGSDFNKTGKILLR